jgi:hypothetical protein
MPAVTGSAWPNLRFYLSWQPMLPAQGVMQSHTGLQHCLLGGAGWYPAHRLPIGAAGRSPAIRAWVKGSVAFSCLHTSLPANQRPCKPASRNPLDTHTQPRQGSPKIAHRVSDGNLAQNRPAPVVRNLASPIPRSIDRGIKRMSHKGEIMFTASMGPRSIDRGIAGGGAGRNPANVGLQCSVRPFSFTTIFLSRIDHLTLLV